MSPDELDAMQGALVFGLLFLPYAIALCIHTLRRP